MENVLALYTQEPVAGRARLCFDERPCQLLEDVIAALSLQPGKAVKENNEYLRQGTCGVLLAYDMDTDQRYTQVRKQRTKADYAEFMQEIVTSFYSHVGYVDVVQDNLNTHRYGSFYEYLPLEEARTLSRKLVFYFTPKHGSWLNIAEIEFSALARQCLNRRIGSLEELARQVELWTTERNERAVKVHWSFTIAGATDNLKRWYEQVNPANKPLDSNH